MTARGEAPAATRSAHRNLIPEEDRLALQALSHLEPTEPSLDVGVRPRVWRAKATVSLTRDRWFDYLYERGLIHGPGRTTGWPAEVLVPCWVNDLLATVVPGHVDLEDQRAALRLARRAIRACARSPLFRAALAAEAARLRPLTVNLRNPPLRCWLLNYPWETLRPVNSRGASKTGDAAKAAGDDLP